MGIERARRNRCRLRQGQHQLTPSTTLSNPQLLNGWTLGGCTNCNSLSSIDYEGRELSVKAATD